MRLFTNIIVFFTIVLSLLSVGCGPNQQQLEQFASCLNEKGVVMYGASWCPHCTEQKELFGAAFSKIKYVECVAEENKCTEEGIQFLPTWKFADKSTLIGVMKFSELAQKSGCVLN